MNDESDSRRCHADRQRVDDALGFGPTGRAAAAAVLAVAGWLSLSALAPPDEAAGTAGDWSLERATADVEALAGAPRPVGSAAHARARRYLVDEIRRAGLDAEVQEAVVPAGEPPGIHRLTRVRNVFARLPGRRAGDALLLVAHYDSVPASPGAGDDAAGVAAVLETMRVMAGEGRPERDVIFLFTDAEEMGLLGARAFVDAGLADGVDWVLNFEARGAAGASLMFETLPGDVAAMRFFAETSPRPAASSYSYDVYRRMPNDTDFSVMREVIPAGFNFAFIEDPAAYHSSVDTPERLNRGSLVHHGIQALALARGLSESPPAAGGERAVYFNLPGYGLAVYPAAWDSYAAVVTALLALVVIAVGLYWKRLQFLRLLTGAGLVLVAIASSVAVLMALNWIWMEGFAMARDTRGALTLLGHGWLLVGGGVAWLFGAWISRWAGVVHLAVAAAFWWTLLAGLSAWHLESSAFLFTWPVLFAWLALLPVVIRGGRESRWMGPLLLAGALPAVMIWLPTLKGLAVALGPVALVLGIAAALPVALLSLQASQLTGAGRTRGVLPALVLVAGLGTFGWAVVGAGPSPSSPRTDSLVYALDAGTGEAFWASYDESPDDWTRRVLGKEPSRREVPEFFSDDLELMTAPAEVLPLPGPEIGLAASEVLADGGRRVTMTVRSAREAPVMEVSIRPEGELRRAWVGGEPLEVDDSFRLAYHAVPREGIRLVLELAGAGPVDVAAVDGSFGLPDFTPARPPGLQPRREPWTLRDRKFPVSDVTLVRAHRTIGEETSGFSAANPRNDHGLHPWLPTRSQAIGSREPRTHGTTTSDFRNSITASRSSCGSSK